MLQAANRWLWVKNILSIHYKNFKKKEKAWERKKLFSIVLFKKAEMMSIIIIVLKAFQPHQFRMIFSNLKKIVKYKINSKKFNKM